jgi:hypothetical protein
VAIFRPGDVAAMKWIAKFGRYRLDLRGWQIRLSMAAAVLCLIGAVVLLPRAIESVNWLLIADDPAALADRKLATAFDAAVATREIEAALAAKDSELARSFVDLAIDRQVAIDPGLVQKVDDAIKAENTPAAKAGSFLGGLITGEPNDMVSLAGTALGDLFVFGDIRDAIREGSRLAKGEEADRLILGLAGVGIAITAGTYASMGSAAPARVGLSVVKAARKTGRLGTQLGEWIVRSMRGVVDWSAMRKAMAGASLTEPAVAVRAVREAVKVEKAEGLLDFARNVGRVQTKAGTRTALDGLKMANSPVEMARIAKLAEKNGNRTRAILKLLGRGAIALTLAAFDLALWIFWALLMVFGFVSSMKAAVERTTHRLYVRKKARRAIKAHRGLAIAEERG